MLARKKLHSDEASGVTMIRARRLAIAVLGAVVLALGPATSMAQEGSEEESIMEEEGGGGGWTERVSFHGFCNWSAGYTDENHYSDLAIPEGNYHHIASALVVEASPYERLRINSSSELLVKGEELELELDFAFVEWMFSDAFKLKIGQVKHPFGFYSEIYDVGTLRPFTALPLSVYGPVGAIAEFYRGVGLSGNLYADSGWGLAYDVYFGAVEMPEDKPWELLEEEEEEGEEEEEEEGEAEISDVVGAKLTLNTPLEGLAIGVAGFTGDLKEKRIRRIVFGAHMEYVLDGFFIRGEYIRLMELPREEEEEGDVVNGFYVEAGYTFFDSLQLVAQYQWSKFEEEEEEGAAEEPAPESLFEHQEIAAAINYWFNPNFVLKLSYHYVIGNWFARPSEEELVVSVEADDLGDRTHVLMFGAAFSF